MRALIEVETSIGGRLSPSQRQFVILQSRKNELVKLGKSRKRSNEEDAMLRKLQDKIKNCRRSLEDFDERLLIKLNVKSDAERQTKRRAGQEMVESSDTDDDSDANSDDTDIGDNGRVSAEPRKQVGNHSEDDEELRQKKSVVSEDPGAATKLQKVHRINFGKKHGKKIKLI